MRDRKVMNMLMPMKRIAKDGKIWWCVYDTKEMKFSTLLCFGKYKTKQACQYAIDHCKDRLTPMRYVALSEGNNMDDELVIFKTNAPVSILKALEQKSRKTYLNNDDVPVWSNELDTMGYVFEYIDSCQNITPWKTSAEWLQNHFIGKNIKEHYAVAN